MTTEAPTLNTRPITPRQQEVLDVMRRHAARGPGRPTLRAIGEALGITHVSAVYRHLRVLVAKGLLGEEVLVGQGQRPITAAQSRVLDVIRASLQEKGRPPTLREIGTVVGIKSTNGVNDHLRALVRKGLITREECKSRAIRIVGETDPTAVPADPCRPAGVLREVPLYEHLSQPTTTSVRVPASAEGVHADFAMRAHGTALAALGVRDGDVLFVSRRVTRETCERRLVVLSSGEGVRRLDDAKGLLLRFEAPGALPIHAAASDFARVVLGVVVAMYRHVA